MEAGARQLNPSAGNHPVTADPGDLAAAVAAGDRSWREMPYYEARFGERGRRFAHSDSGWLALAAAGNDELLGRQMLWLTRVLSSRGMPSWMMERHLGVLHEELVKAAPRRWKANPSLLAAAATLRERRLRQVGDDDFGRLAAAFDARVGPEWSTRLPHMGALLVAAVADERNGMARAVVSLEEWAADLSRFPVAWIGAVRHTLAQARALPAWRADEGGTPLAGRDGADRISAPKRTSRQPTEGAA
jgi:hypothetical protein